MTKGMSERMPGCPALLKVFQTPAMVMMMTSNQMIMPMAPAPSAALPFSMSDS